MYRLPSVGLKLRSRRATAIEFIEFGKGGCDACVGGGIFAS